MLELVESTPLLHGYLENQVFQPSIVRGKEIIWRRAVPIAGRPYLARAAEEHSGPHMPWFWSGERQGGGVLNDMLCHSFEAARFLLAAPGEPREALVVEEVNAQIASLKWTRPEYVESPDARCPAAPSTTRRAPAEDFARASVSLRAPGGEKVLVEATTSWSFVGPALRLRAELLGPEYAMQVDSLTTDLTVFLGRKIKGDAGEDLVEKQNAEQGLMPVVADEAARVRLHRREPAHGAGVPRWPHAGRKLARRPRRHRGADGLLQVGGGRANVRFPAQLDDFVPAVAPGRLARLYGAYASTRRPRGRFRRWRTQRR